MADYIPLDFEDDRKVARVPAPSLALHFLAARCQRNDPQPILDKSRLRQSMPYAAYSYDKLYALAKFLWERKILFERLTAGGTASTREAYRQMSEETSALLDKTDAWLRDINRMEVGLAKHHVGRI